MSCYYPRAFTNTYFRKQYITKAGTCAPNKGISEWKNWGKDDLIKVQIDHQFPELNPLKNITILGEPIEITHLENFTVKINRPDLDYSKLEWYFLGKYLDGAIQKKGVIQKKQCQCDTTLLFRQGCQCGGE